MNDKLKRSIKCWLCLLPIVVVILFPLAVMISTSLKPGNEIFSGDIHWIPKTFKFDNYIRIFKEINFATSLYNSLYTSVLGTLLALVISVPAAYAMAKFKFTGKTIFHHFLLITQMLSPIVLIVGLFKVIVYFNLIDNLNGLVLCYGAYNIAFSVWMLKSYFSTIPKDLEESSFVEGAGYIRTLITIFLPQALPAIVVSAAFSFIFGWNDFVLPLTILRSEEKYTLTIKIFNLVGGRYQVDWEIVMGAIFITSLPVVLIFIYLQKHIIKGLTVGAVK